MLSTFTPYYLHGTTLISAWIGNNIHNKVWDEISYPSPNFNGGTVEVWEEINNFTHTLVDMWLHIHAGIKVKPCWQKGPLE